MSSHHPISDKPDQPLASLALEGAQDGLWDYDLKSGRIYLSSQWKALVGYGTTNLTDDPQEWFSRVHPEDVSSVKKTLKMHLDGKTACFRTEHRLKHADGTFRWVLSRGAALRDEKDTATRIAGTLTDINERKQHELHLSQQLDELRFALASEKVLMEELDRKNQELTALSVTDGLSGLYNHRYIQERFDYEFKRARRYGGLLSCMLIDIDHFKLLNDTYGHQYGDYVIKQIAALIRGRSREVDICGRYGGEEFMVISNVNEKNALLYAQKLHAAIEQHIFEHPSAAIKVTVSIGIAEFRSDIHAKQELIERADQAMYRAKKDGRNRICRWNELEQRDKSVSTTGHDVVRMAFLSLVKSVHHTLVDAAIALVNSNEALDDTTREHSARIARLAESMATHMHLSQEQIEMVRLGAHLHDIGKMCMSGSGNDDEADTDECYKKHPEAGVQLLKEAHVFEKELPVVMYHHEHFDGTGFPHKLCGKDIPIEARIVAVADRYDHLRATKIKGKYMTAVSACAALNKGKKILYCPDCVKALAAVEKVSGRA